MYSIESFPSKSQFSSSPICFSDAINFINNLRNGSSQRDYSILNGQTKWNVFLLLFLLCFLGKTKIKNKKKINIILYRENLTFRKQIIDAKLAVWIMYYY